MIAIHIVTKNMTSEQHAKGRAVSPRPGRLKAREAPLLLWRRGQAPGLRYLGKPRCVR